MIAYRQKYLIVALVIAVVLAGCSDSEEESPPSTTSAPPTSAAGSPPDPVGPPQPVRLSEIARLDRPTAIAQRNGDDSLFVAEKGGVIRTISGGAVSSTPVLDISNDVSDDGERGLLGLVFAPTQNVFYINYTDNAGDTRIVEYALDNGGRADLRSRRDLLMVDQPFPNHNGGQLAIGPDGALYIALGDGGGAGDPQRNAQNLSSLLGKILRIRPEVQTAGNAYTVPSDNPFTEQGGARAEVWYYGLRNPWRFSFDSANGSIWIADVGQNEVEEINYLPRDAAGGKNFGWPLREGTRRFSGEAPRGAIEPVHEYGRDGGACSVTGGYVYRGSAIPDLTARYLFADYCTGDISVLTRRGTDWEADLLGVNVPGIATFAQDRNGEVYTLSQDGPISRIDPA